MYAHGISLSLAYTGLRAGGQVVAWTSPFFPVTDDCLFASCLCPPILCPEIRLQLHMNFICSEKIFAADFLPGKLFDFPSRRYSRRDAHSLLPHILSMDALFCHVRPLIHCPFDPQDECLSLVNQRQHHDSRQ